MTSMNLAASVARSNDRMSSPSPSPSSTATCRTCFASANPPALWSIRRSRSRTCSSSADPSCRFACSQATTLILRATGSTRASSTHLLRLKAGDGTIRRSSALQALSGTELATQNTRVSGASIHAAAEARNERWQLNAGTVPLRGANAASRRHAESFCSFYSSVLTDRRGCRAIQASYQRFLISLSPRCSSSYNLKYARSASSCSPALQYWPGIDS